MPPTSTGLNPPCIVLTCPQECLKLLDVGCYSSRKAQSHFKKFFRLRMQVGSKVEGLPQVRL